MLKSKALCVRPKHNIVSCNSHELALNMPADSLVPGMVSMTRNKAEFGDGAGLTNALLATAATVGVVVAGAALLELAVIPGVLIGGTAVLAPQYLPKLGRGVRSLFNTSFLRRVEPAAPLPLRADVNAALAPVTIKRAIAKTITFRIIVTTLDFTVNYVVLGEFATAAGLSAFALVAGPLFYLAHETAWNHFSVSDKPVDLTLVLPLRQDAESPADAREGFAISRALAKTITYRTIATIVDFTTNYVVVGDLVTAAGLSASGFILGPFVYWGHEKAWDHYGSPAERLPELPPPARLLPAPG
jgi:uncharacterized membrane protein